MKSKNIGIAFLLILLMTSGACKKLKTPDALKEREEWISSFKDSIDACKQNIEISELQLQDINKRISSLMNEFAYVSNPRQVAGYYILKDWEKKIPLKTTGIYARLTEENTLELIASLTGANFEQISVESEGDRIESAIVKHDQALNYRQNNLTTVCFYGAATDSIAVFIYGYKGSKIKLDFIQGKSVKNIDIPGDEKAMIAKTWELFEAQQEIKLLEKEIWISSKKIDAYRVMLEKENTQPNNNN